MLAIASSGWVSALSKCAVTQCQFGMGCLFYRQGILSFATHTAFNSRSLSAFFTKKEAAIPYLLITC